jgi:uncharacterized membrane protein YhaH (DUF805 family)
MAYQGSREFLSLALRAIRLTFAYSGRSSRTELVGYYLLTLVAGLLVEVATRLLATSDAAYAIRFSADLAVMIPMCSLLVRRTHDVGWSGWWMAPAILVVIYNGALALVARSRGISERLEFEQAAWLMGYVVPIAVVGAFFVMILPGSTGANRFGDDPRGRVV